MENLLFAFKVVFPVFAMMVIGYVLKSVGVISEVTVRQVNKMLFRVCLPFMIFTNIYSTDQQLNFQSRLVLFTVIAIATEFVIGLFLVLAFEKDNSKRGVMLQGMFRSNFVFFGIPIVTAIAGTASAGMASLLIAVVIPLFNFLAVIALEIFHGSRPNFFKIIKGIVTNPLILASAAALLVLHFNIQLPDYIAGTIRDIGSISTPLAFLMLGAYFSFGDIGVYLRQITVTSLFKLLLFPAVILGAAIWMGFRGAELAVLLSVFASPVAINSFTMAQEMGGDERLAGQLIVFTSILSVASVFLFVFILRQFAML